MGFAKWVFLLAGITGVMMVIPPYFLEEQFGRDHPPPIHHPEFYYGFFGVTLSWQLMFLVIGSDPIRFRRAMIPAMCEKASFALAIPRGKPVLLKVEAGKMHRQGFTFFLSANGVWLTDLVPVAFLTRI
jgi:hypothetical protein